MCFITELCTGSLVSTILCFVFLNHTYVDNVGHPKVHKTHKISILTFQRKKTVKKASNSFIKFSTCLWPTFVCILISMHHAEGTLSQFCNMKPGIFHVTECCYVGENPMQACDEDMSSLDLFSTSKEHVYM